MTSSSRSLSVDARYCYDKRNLDGYALNLAIQGRQEDPLWMRDMSFILLELPQ